MTDDEPKEFGPITHIAVTSDGTKVTLYVNGSVIASMPAGAGTIEWWPHVFMTDDLHICQATCQCGASLDELGRCIAVTDFGQHRGHRDD
jgi:hypothetical protein